MKQVLIKYSEVSSNHVRSKSHEEKGWINTDMFQVISYSYARDLIN
jgi:uncharacterized phage-associated protein